MGGLGAPTGASMGDTSCQVRPAYKPLSQGRFSARSEGDEALVVASAGELERLPDQPLDGRLPSVGRTAQGDVPRLLARALEQAAFLLDLPAAIQEHAR